MISPNFLQAQTEDRVADASKRKLADVRRQFEEAGASWPPTALHLIAYKIEGELEVWSPSAKLGPNSPWVLVRTFPILGRSGGLGPKRREGDRQVPEGLYQITHLNPKSHFHLSLGLNYPNASDRVRSDAKAPGSDIFIHGGSATIGCLPLGDDGVEDLYLAVHAAKETRAPAVSIHLFPFRMSGETLVENISQSPEHTSFWQELRPIYQVFDETKVPPKVHTTGEGAYVLAP